MYISTRGGVPAVMASGAIYQGLAADGGLYVPTALSVFPAMLWQKLPEMGYVELAETILSLYLDDFSAQEIAQIARAAYGVNFDDPAIAPLQPLSDDRYVLELWHGPTAAFKDMALQILPHLLRVSMKKQQVKEEVVILVATSGDTGKAALEGFADVDGVRIIVFYPDGGVSEVQRLQMVTQTGANTHVVAVRGNFDDCQRGVKQIFNDKAFRSEQAARGYLFSSANSINWGRLLPQIVYYFKAYGDLVHRGALKLGDKMDVVVPTGNFGNILAGYYAQRMGLPIGDLICASNKNRILTDVIETGVYDRNRDFYRTSSPSMDILISSNFERFLFEMTARNSAKVCELLTALDRDGVYRLDAETHRHLRGALRGFDCDEAQTLATIRETFEQAHYLIDTHTAVAVHALNAARRCSGSTRPAVIVSTANPYKFNVSVFEALKGEGSAAGLDEFTVSDELSALTGTEIHRALRGLDTRPVLHNTVIDSGEMAATVSKLLR